MPLRSYARPKDYDAAKQDDAFIGDGYAEVASNVIKSITTSGGYCWSYSHLGVADGGWAGLEGRRATRKTTSLL